MAKFLDVCTKKDIRVGEEKKRLWFKIGAIKITSNGAWYLQLFHSPDTDYYVIPKDKEELPTIQLAEAIPAE